MSSGFIDPEMAIYLHFDHPWTNNKDFSFYNQFIHGPIYITVYLQKGKFVCFFHK